MPAHIEHFLSDFFVSHEDCVNDALLVVFSDRLADSLLHDFIVTRLPGFR